MLERVLTEAQRRVLRRERRVLGELRALLARLGAPAEAQSALVESIAQLDELFLLVVVGEFNAGKSALINALLGTRLLAEGVTPTTADIHLIGYGASVEHGRSREGFAVVSAPVELLREINLVDTPGTNAIDRRHEALTEEFVPRSDLVLFVTSADRPFTESERAFLERLRAWGKKVVVVLNKVDILESEGEVASVVTYITTSCEKLLGFAPQIFPLSARRGSQDEGFAALEGFIQSTLDQAERVRLKLLNPLRVGRRLAEEQGGVLGERLELLQEDLQTLDDLERQQRVYREDMEREFRFRLADVERLLQQLENRGIAYFDDTLRLLRLPDLLSKSRLELEFGRQVVADTPQQVEAQVSDLIDWMVDSELRQWRGVMELVSRRRAAHGDRLVGEVGGELITSRGTLLESLGKTAQQAVEGYDQRREASRLADSVQKSVAGAALLEAGALGLGALITLAATSTAADITGILAAGTLATLGLFVIPARRRRAKATLRERLGELRVQLIDGMSEEFSTQVDRSLGRIVEATAPYTRFVRGERERIAEEKGRLEGIDGELRELEGEVEHGE